MPLDWNSIKIEQSFYLSQYIDAHVSFECTYVAAMREEKQEIYLLAGCDQTQHQLAGPNSDLSLIAYVTVVVYVGDESLSFVC